MKATLRVRRLIFAGYLLCVLLLSVMPGPESVRLPRFPHLDKVVHFILYAVMSGLLLNALRSGARRSIKAGLAVVILCSAYGLLLEMLQGVLTESRQMSMGDFAANFAGALSGAVFFESAGWIKKTVLWKKYSE
ncbi:MAG: VanZ family protein [Verrucomicrobiota bacterium]